VCFVGEVLKSGMVPTVIDERTCEVICLVGSTDHLVFRDNCLIISYRLLVDERDIPILLRYRSPS